MFQTVAVATAASFVVLAIVALAGVAVSRRMWRGAPAIAVCYGIGFVALVSWVQFLFTWASPRVGVWISWVLLVGCLAVVVASRPWRWASFLLAPLVVTAGLGATYQALMYLWKSNLEPFPLSALRFSFNTAPYPVDNAIPWLMANAIESGKGTHGLILGWNGSDRPPLESGTILLVQHLVGWLHPSVWTAPAYGAGFVLQILWIPALWALLEVIGIARAVAALATVFVGVTGTLVVNSIYTWPKLVCAALVCGALAVLVATIRGRTALVPGLAGAAAMYALAMLSHGAAAFTLPAVGVLAVWAIARGRGRRWGSIAVAAASAIVVYAPWIAYQRFYDPPGDRLLRMHLAGVDGFDDRSLLSVVVDQYSMLNAGSWLRGRWDNLAQVLSPGVIQSFDGHVTASGAGLVGRMAPDFSALSPGAAVIGEWRWHEYYEWASSLSLGAIVLLAFLAAIVVGLARRGFHEQSWWPGLLLGLMAVSMLFWVVLMFVPGSTVVHQGSHVWIVVPLGLAVAWLAERRFRLGVAAVVAQAVVTAVIYGPFFGYTQLSPAALVVGFGGCFAVVATLVGLRRGAIRPVAES